MAGQGTSLCETRWGTDFAHPFGTGDHSSYLIALKVIAKGQPAELSDLRSRPPSRRRHFKPVEFEPRRNGTAGQRPVAEARGSLPCMSRHHGLRAFAGQNIGAEAQPHDRA